MPYRKSYKGKRKFKRRIPRRRKRYRKNVASRFKTQIMRGPSFMPDKALNSMKFVTHHALSYIAASEADVRISANDVFSPLNTISAQHAVGFAEMSGVYQRFQVLGSRIRVSCSNPDSAQPYYLAVMPMENLGSTAGLTAMDLAGNPYCKFVTLSPDGSGTSTRTVTNYAKSKVILGYQNVQSVTTWGSDTASPTLEWIWTILGSFPDSTTTTVHLTLDLTYYVQWSRKDVQDQSGA